MSLSFAISSFVYGSDGDGGELIIRGLFLIEDGGQDVVRIIFPSAFAHSFMVP
jgi:hypothetical protein